MSQPVQAYKAVARHRLCRALARRSHAYPIPEPARRMTWRRDVWSQGRPQVYAGARWSPAADDWDFWSKTLLFSHTKKTTMDSLRPRTRGCSSHMQEVQQWSFPDAHGVQSLNSIRAQASNNPGEEQLSKKFYLIPKTCACSYQTEFVPEVRTTHASLHNSPLGLMCNMHILPEDLVPQTPH